MSQAAELFEIMGDPGVTAWLITGQLLPFLGFPVLYAGLARAGSSAGGSCLCRCSRWSPSA